MFNRKTLEFLDGFGSWGSGKGQFGTLHHLSVDSKGNLYTAESNAAETGEPTGPEVHLHRFCTDADGNQKTSKDMSD